MKNKRPKKWVGALIGGGISLVSQLISQNAQRQAQEQQNALAQKQAAEQNAILTAQNLTNQYANQEYADKFKEKVVFKNGGAVYTDRIKNIKRFKCGGKRK